MSLDTLGEKIKIANQMVSYTGTIVNYLNKKDIDFASIGITLEHYLDKSLHPNTKITKIFSISKPSYSEDGTSMETAIFLKMLQAFQSIYKCRINIWYKKIFVLQGTE